MYIFFKFHIEEKEKKTTSRFSGGIKINNILGFAFQFGNNVLGFYPFLLSSAASCIYITACPL